MDAFLSSLIFLTAAAALFFLPGLFLLRAFFGSWNTLTPFETLILSFCLGITLVNFLLMGMGKLGIFLGPVEILSGIAISLAASFLVALVIRRFDTDQVRRAATKEKADTKESFSFSKRQSLLFILLLCLTFAIKVIYLSHAILPTSTDLGHHMYWAKLVAETGTLPYYAEQEITGNDESGYELTDPKPIADFIIGEHLPFSAMNIVAKADFFSAFPVLFLFLVNILSLFALVAFAFRLARELRVPLFSYSLFSAQNLALAVLFLFGPLYTLASPQAKFVSGGVVGNSFGILFIPLILLCYYQAFSEKRPAFLALGFLFTFSLAYIHHLSTLVLLFILIASALLYLAFNTGNIGEIFRSWWKIFFAPGPILAAVFACSFFFLVALPTYIETQAVDTAIGTPSKATRTGLTYLQVTFSSGEGRVALGLAAIAAVFAFGLRKRYAGAFILGWSLILLIMTLKPGWVFLDIPSNRIGSYLSFPLGILAAIGLVWTFASFKKGEAKTRRFPPALVILFFFTALVFAAGSGSYDNGQTLLPKSKALAALETFHASEYLAAHNRPEDLILKDHNYIAADAWIKLFFLRDYFYPLSRGFFSRYEDNPGREQCTLLMISVPNTPKGERCYQDTGTNIVIVNPLFDSVQFEKSGKFSRIYASDLIHIYQRKP